MGIEWDAEKYARDFAFVPRFGGALLELLDAPEGAAVLDLGCGNGALTKALQGRGYAARGLDASEALLRLARESYPDICFTLGDATDFALDAPVDAVFSNAVLHWIDASRQRDMLRCVRRALRPGGQFVFELGGRGNNARIHAALAEAFARHGRAYRVPFFFPSLGEYAAMLEDEGFSVTYAALFDRPTPLSGEDGMADWLRMFVKTPFEGVEADEREAIVRETVEALRGALYKGGAWVADYVRLRMKAIRA